MGRSTVESLFWSFADILPPSGLRLRKSDKHRTELDRFPTSQLAGESQPRQLAEREQRRRQRSSPQTGQPSRTEPNRAGLELTLAGGGRGSLAEKLNPFFFCTLRCSDAKPLSVGVRWIGPGNGPGTADHCVRERRAGRRIISLLYPVIIGPAAFVTGRWTFAFLCRDPMCRPDLCRITIIRHKRIS